MVWNTYTEKRIYHTRTTNTLHTTKCDRFIYTIYIYGKVDSIDIISGYFPVAQLSPSLSGIANENYPKYSMKLRTMKKESLVIHMVYKRFLLYSKRELGIKPTRNNDKT